LQTAQQVLSRCKISRAVASAICVCQQRVAARCEPSEAVICLGCCRQLLWHADEKKSTCSVDYPVRQTKNFASAKVSKQSAFYSTMPKIVIEMTLYVYPSIYSSRS